MKDYTSKIKEILSDYSGWVKNEDLQNALNETLNALLERQELSNLATKFLSCRDSMRALDILFEIKICRLLLENNNIKKLTYEPNVERGVSCPDFRIEIEDKTIDIQVKRIVQIEQEIIKEKLIKELKKRFVSPAYSYVIEIWISDKIMPRDINEFLNKFKKDFALYKQKKEYSYAINGKKLVRFRLLRKRKNGIGLSLGMIHYTQAEDGLAKKIDITIRRKKIRKLLRIASQSFPSLPSNKHFNYVFMSPDSTIWFSEDDVDNCLYGDEGVRFNSRNDKAYGIRGKNGLFSQNSFKKINALIFVHPSFSIVSDDFPGCLYANEKYLDEIPKAPEPFKKPMKCFVLPEWRGERVEYTSET